MLLVSDLLELFFRGRWHRTADVTMNDSILVLELLQTYFGYSSFRGQQRAVIEHVLSGQHALVIMPTGMGKSLCYQIPALAHAAKHAHPNECSKRGLTLIISPLIALMKDQVDSLIKRRILASFINSSLTRNEREKRYAAVAQGDFNLLYVTPERFRKPEFLDVISRRRIDCLAVDEAHCISEWGHDFRPDYTRLQEFRSLLGHPTTIALTATATPDVQRDIIQQLGLTEGEVRLFHEGIDRPNLQLTVENVWDDDEKLAQFLSIRNKQIKTSGCGIVYFTLIKTLTKFSERLQESRVPHVCYHGDLERQERKRIQSEFMHGSSNLVLATNAFGMGIDKEDIRFVVHAEIPGSMESYYQEIGRAGRDGLPSRCTLLYDERDLATQMEFIRWSNPDAEFYRRVYDFLVSDMEQISAFGMEWLKQKLHGKQRHDHRLETVLSMLDRHAVIEGTVDPFNLEVIAELSPQLCDQPHLEEKLRRDMEKLYKLLEYVKCDGNRKKFIHDYFGLPYPSSTDATRSRHCELQTE